eukprot:TRINITY_DN5399_c0_g1_i5.p1 TRINITY_DN5399_c0_g1~~TRINITY_DN5399_c0_g1_i5.p1  ORF type:complete len:586 (+),score=134.45 TRINITY_DN5399_c0_g1_i5:69-1826(+)
MGQKATAETPTTGLTNPSPSSPSSPSSPLAMPVFGMPSPLPSVHADATIFLQTCTTTELREQWPPLPEETHPRALAMLERITRFQQVAEERGDKVTDLCSELDDGLASRFEELSKIVCDFENSIILQLKHVDSRVIKTQSRFETEALHHINIVKEILSMNVLQEIPVYMRIYNLVMKLKEINSINYNTKYVPKTRYTLPTVVLTKPKSRVELPLLPPTSPIPTTTTQLLPQVQQPQQPVFPAFTLTPTNPQTPAPTPASPVFSFTPANPTSANTTSPTPTSPAQEPLPRTDLEKAIDRFGRWIGSGFNYIDRGMDSINGPRQTIGSRGPATDQFIKPFGIGISPIDGNIYIADAGNGRIQIVSPDMRFVRSFGVQGTGPAQLSDPSGVTFSLDGQVCVVTDQGNNRVHLYTHDGQFVKTISGTGSAPGAFNKPYFAVFDLDNYFYVSDMRNMRVQKFTADGDFVQFIGNPGSAHEVGTVCGIMVNDDNELMTISNPGDTVMVWTTDGRFLRGYGVELTHRLDNYLARSFDNGFILTDYGFNKVHFYTRDGVKLRTFEFRGPVGAEFDRDARLFLPSWSNGNFTLW